MEKFPDKILTYILGFESDPLLYLAMYLCGNRSFNQRLKLGGCREIRTARRMELIGKLPQIITELDELEVVDISALKITDKVEAIAREIRMWPSTLRQLRISLPNISTAFLLKTVTSSRSHHSHTHEPDPATLPIIWRLVDFFPHLEVLKLDDLGKGPSIGLRSLDWGSFPPTLVELDWPALKHMKGDFATLSRKLKTLKLAKQISHSPKVLSTLPPMLTHLSGIQVTNDEQITVLPRMLAHGDWIETIPVYTIAVASALPRIAHLSHDFKLDETGFRKRGVDWVLTLSRGLVSLKIAVMLTADQISILPRTLRSLEEISLFPLTLNERIAKSSEEETAHIWPPKLTSLIFHKKDTPFYDASELMTLPSTLTRLHNIGRTNMEPEAPSVYAYFDCLPPGITDLVVRDNQSRSVTFDEGKLPEKLIKFSDAFTKLAQDTSITFKDQVTYLGLKSVSFKENLKLVKQLPSFLTVFKIGALSVSHLGYLPRTLTRLSIRDFVGDWDDGTLDKLPPDVTKLTLKRVVTEQAFIPHEAFIKIRPNLTTLKILRSRLGLDILTSIPDTIEHLDLRISNLEDDQITDELFEGLPQRWIAWLPTQYPKNNAICAKCIAFWPPTVPMTKELINAKRRIDKLEVELRARADAQKAAADAAAEAEAPSPPKTTHRASRMEVDPLPEPDIFATMDD